MDKKFIEIPMPFHVCLDDIGWFCGRDDRKIGGPSRSGVNTRLHKCEDYEALEYLGSLTGMKISCGMVMGEWDMEDNLNEIPYLSHFGESWQNSKFRDKKEMEKMVDIINNSPHIDICLHGLYHGYYMKEADWHDSSDFYYRINKKLFMIPEEEVRMRVEKFFYLLDYHKIKKGVNQFIPPSFTYEENALSNILKDYGIKYVSTIFEALNNPAEKTYDKVFIDNNIITVDRKNNIVPWNEMEADFVSLENTKGILGIHWPNILHSDPEKSIEIVENCAKYINRCCDEFGTVPAYDMASAATQLLYEKHALLTEGENEAVIDVSSVPKSENMINHFYVSTLKPIKQITGASFSEFKKYKEHTTYQITPKEELLNIYF